MLSQDLVVHPLNILLFKEGEVWVAQCLEHDVVGSGVPTVEEAIVEWKRMWCRYISLVHFRKGAKLPTTFPPPSDVYIKHYAKASFYRKELFGEYVVMYCLLANGKMPKCADCGLRYDCFGCDCALPDQQWKKLFPEEVGMLCANCICRRIERSQEGFSLLGWIA